eukprot:Rhum_TRINITY_DN23289_c0_g1::Rhum_TRINITY_DN23289_c0_g1_i1::g.177627::m.177627/K01286/E3.4.16.4; D-alanyl-D-alanine carboxypeptidase
MRAAAALLLCSACFVSGLTYPSPAELEEILQPVAEQVSKAYNCSFAIAFRGGDSRQAQVAYGDATGTGVNVKTTDSFVWGSVTKMLTGTNILQLVEQGKISLDSTLPDLVDPIIQKAPGLNFTSVKELWGANVTQVTVYDLLHMSSGVPDFDTATPGKKMTDSFRAFIYKHPHTAFSPYQLMDVPWVRTGHLLYPPGTKQSYSSTNFMLLGLIAASQEGEWTWDKYDQKTPIPEDLKADFAETHFAVHGAPSEYTDVHGFDRTTYNGQSGKGQGVDVWDIEGVFAGWTASDIVAPVSNMANLAYFIYGPDERLIAKKYQDMMIPTDGFYGLATFNLTWQLGKYAQQHGHRSYGHLGATYGYQSVVSYHPELEFSLAVASDIETDFQTQPSMGLCLAFNLVMANMTDTPLHCEYKVSGYYGGDCNCTEIHRA